MERISVSQLSSVRWSFFLDVVRYNYHGFNSIGIWRQKLDDCDLLEAIDFLHEMKTEVSSVHWAGGFTGSSGVSFEDALQDAREAIELTSKLSGDCLIIHPGCRNGHTTSHALRLLAQALETLVPMAADYDVRLALELMPCAVGRRWTFLESLHRTLGFAKDFPAQQLGFVLDLYHVGLNADVFEILPEIIGRIFLVQLADRRISTINKEDRRLLGEGDVSLVQWFDRLNELGYRGSYELELHGDSLCKIPYTKRLQQSREFLMSMVPQLDEEMIRVEARLPRRDKPNR